MAAGDAWLMKITGRVSSLDGVFAGSVRLNVVATGKGGRRGSLFFVAGDVGVIGCVYAQTAALLRARRLRQDRGRCSSAPAFRASLSRRPLLDLELVPPRGCWSRFCAGSCRGTRAWADGRQSGRFRDRAAGFTLAGLVCEAWRDPRRRAAPALLIEVNHVDAELVVALTETSTVSPDLHVPLQPSTTASCARWIAVHRVAVRAAVCAGRRSRPDRRT